MVVAASCIRGCGSGQSHALYSTTNPWGQATHTDPVGQVWAATGVPLCTKGHTPITLTRLEPVDVTGQIRVDRILAQPGHWGELAFYRGTPPGSRPASGFVIPSPSPCAWPPRYQAIVLAHRTGSGRWRRERLTRSLSRRTGSGRLDDRVHVCALRKAWADGAVPGPLTAFRQQDARMGQCSGMTPDGAP